METFGMNKEELIQWACSHSALTEKELRKILPEAEVYCVSYPTQA